MAGYIDVPHAQLSSAALEALLEEFITREGTDYGLVEHTLESKKASVRAQLERGHVVIVFDPESESVTLLRREELVNAPSEGEGYVDEDEHVRADSELVR